MSYNTPSDNPWQDQPGQTGTRVNPNPYQDHSGQSQNDNNNNPYNQQNFSHSEASPWSQEQSHGQPQHQSYHPLAQPQAGQPTHGAERQQQQPSYLQDSFQGGREETPPGLPPRRTATEMALPTGQDRSHQIEVMQSYEAAGRKDEDDSNVEILQREFPKLDGSLIAAIYGDSKSLSATREMLQALE